MNRDDFTLIQNADDEVMQVVDQGLTAFNRSQVGDHPSRPVRLALKDSGGEVVGGLRAGIVWDWMYVLSLWIHESHRGQGLGSILLAEAEQIATEEKVVGAYLVTYDFQSREFYERHGYRVTAEVPHHPGEHTMFFMVKEFERESEIERGSESVD